jgi:hypothetical protein
MSEIHVPDPIPSSDDRLGYALVRLRKEYGIEGEVLYMGDLARVLGVKVDALWNRRARGKMPAIPRLIIGGQDAFYIVDVARFLTSTFAPDIQPPIFPIPSKVPASAGIAIDKKSEKDTSSVKTPKAAKRQRSVQQELIRKLGQQILDEKRRQRGQA